jgi:catechol 2,3-dioxygenase-like lactoylglutathione lyase family enzyme
MYRFYGEVLGLERLPDVKLASGETVARFRVGLCEVKLNTRAAGKTYHPGSVSQATGLRLLTFFYSDESEIAARFRARGLLAPRFRSVAGLSRRAALVRDPDGQFVELVIAPGAAPETYQRVAIGLTVSNIQASRAFYRSFVGLQEGTPTHDPIFDTMVYPFSLGSTTIELRSFNAHLPADTGSGGLQYVVTDVEAVNRLALSVNVSVDEPLSMLKGLNVRTLWLADPDGITNYFAETAASRAARRDSEDGK